MATPNGELGEVIVEFTRNGTYLKCTAIHVATGKEVSAIGPVTDRHAVQRIAVAKLKRALGLS